MYDLNDAQPQMPPIGDLIPDGTFAKVTVDHPSRRSERVDADRCWTSQGLTDE